ncbi:GatB/YqeY domain-containing protein [Anaerolineae bacterium CFX9]|nr:GatB/YqeY domain-containing protein [Anaerolineae bacterium CFX9]
MEDPRVRIQEALKQAMIAKDATRRDTLRMIQSAFKQVEVDERRELTAEDAVAVLQREVKKRRESVEEARRIGRSDIADSEAEQLAVLEAFLPRQMSRDEIAVLVQEVIAATGASSGKDMGKVMGALMPKVKGLADGRLVNEVVRELLGA